MPTERAFYYVRVIQIPSPRWTAYDQKRYGIKMSDDVPMTVTDRAYTSPIWYYAGQLTEATDHMKRLIREPLLHFLLLGAAIFAAYSVVSRGSSASAGRSSSRKASSRRCGRASPARDNGSPPARSGRV